MEKLNKDFKLPTTSNRSLLELFNLLNMPLQRHEDSHCFEMSGDVLNIIRNRISRVGEPACPGCISNDVFWLYR